MPIRIRVDVNGEVNKTFWIGRISGGQNANDLNTYVIGEGTGDLEAWNMPGVKGTSRLPHFTHRYGDGLETCVARGMNAMGVTE
jgi:hypothetical protein